MVKSLNQGCPFPLGASPVPGGVNFSLYSTNASSVELVLFSETNSSQPDSSIILTRELNRSGDYWHVFLDGIKAGQLYGYRVNGPAADGNMFDPQKLLLDPYSYGVNLPTNYSRQAATAPGSNSAFAMKSVVVDLKAYAWEEDQPLRRPWANQVIYEVHCGGFTKHPSSRVNPEKQGTFAGIIEKIPYLYDLGVTALQLMPVWQFDLQDSPPGLINYWGYSPVSLFAPHSEFCEKPAVKNSLNQFRDLVKALHRAGIEVLIEFTPGFSAEGGQNGPWLSYRGIDNSSYYLLAPDGHSYQDCFGRGNTLNLGSSVVRRLLIDSLRHWVLQSHIDGFRIDLGMLLQRESSGQPCQQQTLLEDIASDPLLASSKFIFDAQQVCCGSQLLELFADRTLASNSNFTHNTRRFIKSSDGAASGFAQELFPTDLNPASMSGRLNCIAYHNGFTLNDLVSFNQKDNFVNGENNSDGLIENDSWNCGHEGPLAPYEVEKLRMRQVKNFLVSLFLAHGVPLLQMGDEVRRTQQGNNNAYCQDNEISWLDWGLVAKHRPLYRFVKVLIEQRKLFLEQDQEAFGLSELLLSAHTSWHGVNLNQPDWSSFSHSLALTLHSPRGGLLWHLMFNAYWQPLEFEIPALTSFPEHTWRRWIDTSREAPDDICDWTKAPVYGSSIFTVPDRSTVILVARPPR